MNGETHTLFQRVAAKLGWTDRGDLDTVQNELIKSIDKTRRPATSGHGSSQLLDFPSPVQLQLSDSDEDSGKENKLSDGTNGRNKFLMESSDDDFEKFLMEKATPKVKALQRPCGAAKKVSNVPVVIESSDSNGSFETFLDRVKTPKAKAKANSSGSDCRNFIHDSSSSDDDFVVKQKNPSSKVFKTPKPLSTQTLGNKPLSQCNTPVFFSDSEDDDDGIVIRSSWKTRHRSHRPPSKAGTLKNPEDRDKVDSSPFPSPSPAPFSAFLAPTSSPLTTTRAPKASPAPLRRNYSAPSKLEDSDSSEGEFLSLLERLKTNKRTGIHTPASVGKAGPSQRVPVSAPPKKAPKALAPPATGKLPLDVRTPVRRVASSKPAVSQTEPRAGHCSRVPVCKTPGCFLLSLSAPSSTYVRHFKQKKEELTSKLYQLYNTSVFEDKLPTSMSVTWNKKMRKTAGYCVTGQERGGGNRYARIELSEKVCDSTDRLRDTLVHEMCHAATWLINGVRDGHGPFWKVYALKATLAHPELPMVTRCHSYDINYKYQYQCNCCKNTIGRHSKSLNTERFVCALCTGQLVLLNPPKSRAPTPFAKFVKENYGSVRQGLVGQSHADVMRKLSADFASTRLSQS